MLKRLLREPLVHFLILAGLIFAAYGLVAERSPPEDGIVVSQAKIEQMASIFAKTRQRPPSANELKNLIDDYVTEEIYVREAIRLGIDKDDTVIRRRLRLKMEFLGDTEAEATTPSDAELQTYLSAHADRFTEAPRVAFEQVYIDIQKHGGLAEKKVVEILDALKQNAAFVAGAGDSSLLLPSMPPTEQPAIAQVFGDAFASAVVALEPGEWHGPIASTFGLHIVKVTSHSPGRLPPLADIRAQVEREWMNDRRQTLERQKLDELLKRYKVTIEPVATGAPP